MQTRTAPYDIDRWDQTSLTWKPDGHAQSELEARRLAAHKYGNTKDRYRVREKPSGTILFEIGEGKQQLHESLLPKKN
jgi:hypothetical protein